MFSRRISGITGVRRRLWAVSSAHEDPALQALCPIRKAPTKKNMAASRSWPRKSLPTRCADTLQQPNLAWYPHVSAPPGVPCAALSRTTFSSCALAPKRLRPKIGSARRGPACSPTAPSQSVGDLGRPPPRPPTVLLQRALSRACDAVCVGGGRETISW